MRISEILGRLIINKNCTKVSVINPKTKRLEVVFDKRIGDNIIDFRLFGADLKKVVSVTKNGHILLYSLTEGERRGVCYSYRIELIRERKEWPLSISVDPKNEFILVGIVGQRRMCISSRLLLFEPRGDSLAKIGFIDQFIQNIPYQWALECYGSSKSTILWLTLSWKRNGIVYLYAYSKESGKLKELEEMRVVHQEYRTWKLLRLDGELYYTGELGKLMNLRVL